MSLVERLRMLREANAVQRCHIIPHVGEYSVGHHCANALALLFVLHTSPSMPLVLAVLWHDMPERFLGDMPATAKWSRYDLADAYNRAELYTARQMVVPHESELSDEDRSWLRAVDALEFWHWCRDQLLFGNRHVRRSYENICNYLNVCEMPREAVEYYKSAVADEPTRGKETIE
jgi:hypothetical protein